MLNDPKISIIVGVYNGEETIQRCIDSVYNQLYTNKELIIIDGKSNDNTTKILKKNESKITYWISEKDRGLADAWNKAISQAKGQWLLFLGADDLLDNPKSLLLASKVLINNPQYDVIYGKVALINKQGNTIRVVGSDWKFSEFKKFMSIPHQSAFHSTNLFKDVGYYAEQFTIVSDYELLLRKNKELKVLYFEEIIAKMQTGGMSQTQIKNVYKEWLQAQLLHKIAPNYYLKIHYYFKLLKHSIRNIIMH